jgi:hypothetical protein
MDATLALDDHANLYVLVPHNSAFSGQQVTSVPGVYVYGPNSDRPAKVYKLPPLALTWSANSMVVIPPPR